MSKVSDARQAVRRRNAQYILDYLSTHPCIHCGESRVPALDFVPRVKLCCPIRNMHEYSVATLHSAMDKCDVVCANCRKCMKDE